MDNIVARMLGMYVGFNALGNGYKLVECSHASTNESGTAIEET